MVSCPCGVRTSAAAGDTVECACGRRWDTTGVPEQDLAGVSSVLRRSRARRLVFIANLLLVAAVLVVIGRSSPLLATLVAGFVWWRFCRPEWRRRREAPKTSALPTWRLHASGRTPAAQPGEQAR